MNHPAFSFTQNPSANGYFWYWNVFASFCFWLMQTKGDKIWILMAFEYYWYVHVCSFPRQEYRQKCNWKSCTLLLQKGIFVLMEYYVIYGPKFHPELVSSQKACSIKARGSSVRIVNEYIGVPKSVRCHHLWRAWQYQWPKAADKRPML